MKALRCGPEALLWIIYFLTAIFAWLVHLTAISGGWNGIRSNSVYVSWHWTMPWHSHWRVWSPSFRVRSSVLRICTKCVVWVAICWDLAFINFALRLNTYFWFFTCVRPQRGYKHLVLGSWRRIEYYTLYLVVHEWWIDLRALVRCGYHQHHDWRCCLPWLFFWCVSVLAPKPFNARFVWNLANQLGTRSWSIYYGIVIQVIHDVCVVSKSCNLGG